MIAPLSKATQVQDNPHELTTLSQILSLYRLWEEKLIQTITPLSELPMSTKKASVIKRLCYDEKWAFVESFFRIPELNLLVAPSRDIRALEREIETVKKKVKHVEDQLLQEITLSFHLASSMLHILTNNYYAHFASMLVEGTEAALLQNKEWSRYLKLDTPLSPGGMHLAKTLVAIGWVFLSVMESKWTHLPTLFAMAAAELCTPRGAFWLSLLQRIGGNEKHLARCLPFLHKGIRMSLVVALGSYFYSKTPTEMGLLYLSTYAVHCIAIYCLSQGYSYLGKTRTSHSFQLLQGLMGWIAPLLAGKVIQYYDPLKPTITFQDEAACNQSPKECQQLACAHLGFKHKKPTPQEITTTYRALARTLHPDKTISSREAFKDLLRAKTLCLQ